MKSAFLQMGLLATVLLAGGHSASWAQTTDANYIDPYGQYRMGIGTLGTYNAGYTHSFLGFNASHNPGGGWTLGTDTAHNGGVLILGGIGGDFKLYTFPSNNATSPQTITESQVATSQPNFSINGNGQVRIGLTAPTGAHTDYLLAVSGKLVAKSLYVTAPTNWADFVFTPSYKLMSLPSLEAYLRLNKHLPALPAASEVEANGYSVTEMDAKLLQSVEELTLHVIELSKQNALLQVRLKRMEQQIKKSKSSH